MSRSSTAGFPAFRFFNSARIAAGALAVALTLGTAGVASAHGFKIGSITIGHPWSRATPPGAAVGGGYLTLTNEGDTPDTLVSATIEVADKAEVHAMAVKDGVMTMRALPDGLVLPPHETVKLTPSGYHLMFMPLKQPLVKGDMIAGTLTFEKAGTVKIEFKVDAIGATPQDDHSAHGDDAAMPGMDMSK